MVFEMLQIDNISARNHVLVGIATPFQGCVIAVNGTIESNTKHDKTAPDLS
ncbi:hypothetical protein QFZ34_001401 [Phyllobacterium ifriqiyense]|uniref:Uncharacterized protein n=1 Tax=Phyllobacterium ifriqiyense TaxID=314238 RepID=A0ABU0S645_9HYPH|nr:hypothetical protein [Phyllobacterium ifriqiyense]